MYILLSGKPPFDGQTDLDIMRKVAEGGFSIQGDLWKSISNEGKSLMIRMMTSNYKNRPHASELL